MKKLTSTIFLTAALFAGNAFAAEKPDSMPPTMGYFDEHRMQMHNDQMEAHLKDMQTLMDKLHSTKNASERKRMLQEHRKQMNDLMSEMRSSRENMVMGMMGGGPKSDAGIQEGEKKRQYLIEKRLDMMDNAMEMMMQRDEMMMNR